MLIIGISTMSGFRRLDKHDIPSILTAATMIVTMIVTYSISMGLALGFVVYFVSMIAFGRIKEMSPLMFIIAIVLGAFFGVELFL